MTYYESSDKGHEEMSYCESSEESLSYDKLSGYFLVLPGLTRFLNIKKKKFQGDFSWRLVAMRVTLFPSR